MGSLFIMGNTERSLLHCYNFVLLWFQVVLDKLALDKEKRDLLQENTQLRAVLKQYLDGNLLKYIFSDRSRVSEVGSAAIYSLPFLGP